MNSQLPLIQRSQAHADRTAIVDGTGRYTYRDLLNASGPVASRLLQGSADLAEARIAVLLPPGFAYAAAQWGIWRAGGVFVPLGLSHPEPELEYVLNDTRAAALIVEPSLAGRVNRLAEARGLRLIELSDSFGAVSQAADAGEALELPVVQPDRRAMILYTSGTTSKPKGVVTTHANVQAQVESLIDAWAWTADDHLLHVLPLHHIHGIINGLTCALWAGATCDMLPRFDAANVWERIARSDLTLFMGVPTMYARLIAFWEQAPPEQQNAMSAGCRALRLMVSGSAALPVTTLKNWQSISGHVLLERYGMTEIGMALSNPLYGERIPGCVGSPLPNVEVRRVDEQGRPAAPDVPAELEVRGPTVFREYWNKPEATQAAFHDGWFRTGDVTVVEDGVYRILGRKSVDIIKTGGYKVSALEVEEVLRDHPEICECAVVGIPDDEWGERVAACLVLHDAADLTLKALRDWSKHRLAPYKVPSRMQAVDQLPRNAMGKVQKPVIVRMFLEDAE